MEEPAARLLVYEPRRRGHEVSACRALREGARSDQAGVCRWTGTGATTAADKVPGARRPAGAPSKEPDAAATIDHVRVLDGAV